MSSCEQFSAFQQRSEYCGPWWRSRKRGAAMTAFEFAKLVDVGALMPGLLYPYQSDGVAFLLSKKGAVLVVCAATSNCSALA